MNIFNKIGNLLEKKKKERKNFQNKYWKLSASERIDYDNKLKQIKETQDKKLKINFPVFRSAIMLLLVLIGGIISISFINNLALGKTIDVLRELISFFLKVFFFCLFFDMLAISFNFLCDNSHKKLKELNKRFKL